jgi:hypothetical protein
VISPIGPLMLSFRPEKTHAELACSGPAVAISPLADALTRPELPEGAAKWDYLVVPLHDAKGLKKTDDPWSPESLNELGAQGWEAVGLSLKYGDFIAWPVVLFKRPMS